MAAEAGPSSGLRPDDTTDANKDLEQALFGQLGIAVQEQDDFERDLMNKVWNQTIGSLFFLSQTPTDPFFTSNTGRCSNERKGRQGGRQEAAQDSQGVGVSIRSLISNAASPDVFSNLIHHSAPPNNV